VLRLIHSALEYLADNGQTDKLVSSVVYIETVAKSAMSCLLLSLHLCVRCRLNLITNMMSSDFRLAWAVDFLLVTSWRIVPYILSVSLLLSDVHLTVSQSSDVVLDEMSQYSSCVVFTIVLTMFWHPACPLRHLSGTLSLETVISLDPGDACQAVCLWRLSSDLSPETLVRQVVPWDSCQASPQKQLSGRLSLVTIIKQVVPETVVRQVVLGDNHQAGCPGDSRQAGCPQWQSSSRLSLGLVCMLAIACAC